MFLKSALRILSLLFFSSIVFTSLQAQITAGKWDASLKLNDSTEMPFRMEIEKLNSEYQYIVYNAKEKIILKNETQDSDSIILNFPDFNSVFKFKPTTGQLNGYWINYNRGTDYRIPFEAKKVSKEKKEKSITNFDFTGRWKTTFDVNTPDSSLAIGVFNSKNNQITGTFLTETGDYRFLEGKVNGTKMILSGLDGSHAFLFTGEIINGKIEGVFYSGIHYSGKWSAVMDTEFQLQNPEKITYQTSQDPIKFDLKDVDGNDYAFPNDQVKDKIVIIQIMGTWCSNCIDETKFLSELYNKYHSQGLEIISIGYETPTTFEGQAKKIKLLQTRHNLDFQFLVGGKADKKLVSQHFPMLNSISSYPTSIFIDRNGNVVKIHTGFNGPGTGVVYENFVKETDDLIKKLINKP